MNATPLNNVECPKLRLHDGFKRWKVCKIIWRLIESETFEGYPTSKQCHFTRHEATVELFHSLLLCARSCPVEADDFIERRRKPFQRLLGVLWADLARLGPLGLQSRLMGF